MDAYICMRPKHIRHLTYVLTFFITLHSALVAYINSSALARLISPNQVNIVYTIGFLCAILALILVPRLLKKIGDVRSTLLCIGLEIVTLCGLALFPTSPLFLLFFLLHLVLPSLLILTLDIFLEHASRDDSTGSVRGLYLTFLSSAFVIAPIITGFVLGVSDTYSRVYYLSALVLLPAFLLTLFFFRKFKDATYRQVLFVDGMEKVLRNKELRGIFLSNFILRSFYTIMVIFTPLYLHGELGISWNIIGLLFTIMLLPFVLFEFPLGYLADTRFGEKEILALGFFVMGGATLFLSYIPAHAFILWAVALFLTRTGASAVESMNDTYFFKHVNESDTETIALFRMVEPLAYVLIPLCVALLFLFIDSHFIFVVLGLSVFLGIPLALNLKDTR